MKKLIFGLFFLASVANAAQETGPADTVYRIKAGEGRPKFGSIDLSKSAAVGTSILPVANGGTGNPSGYGMVPPGSIIAWAGGYFNAAGDTYTDVLGNTVGNVNAYVTAYGFKVCDGSTFTDVESPIFDIAGRYLPNLTDNRFLSGTNVISEVLNGSKGGASSFTITSSNLPTHTHGFGTLSAASNGTGLDSHTHNTTITTGGQSATHAHTYNTRQATVTTQSGSGASPIWYGADTGAGTTNASNDHTHTGSGTSGGTSFSLAHTHGMSGATDNGGFANTSIDNRPNYLQVFYLMRVK